MRDKRDIIRFALLLTVVMAVSGPAALSLSAQPMPKAPPAGDDVSPPPIQERMATALRGAPWLFIENVGQFDPRARFQARGGQGVLWLAEDALWITLLEPAPRRDDGIAPWREDEPRARLERERAPRKGVNLRLSFEGANPSPRLEPLIRSETHVSYLIGNDPERWRADVPVWSGVRYADIYPGLDLEVTGAGGRWAWRMVARQGGEAALKAVRLRVEGAEGLRLAADGLQAQTALGAVALPLLQAVDGDGTTLRLPQAGLAGGLATTPPTATAAEGSSASVQADELVYSTLLGGSDAEHQYRLAVDGAGRAYIVGWTLSLDYPVTTGAFDTSLSGGDRNAYVSALNPTGTALIYSTYLGGSDWEFAYGIAVDGAGQAYITGHTWSVDYPTTPGALDTSPNGDADAFVSALNATGTALVYSTYLGGSDAEVITCGIALDELGQAYVTGQTWSADYPVTAGSFDTSYNGVGDAFVSALNAGGTALVYSTYLGGSDWELPGGIAVDGAGRAYVTGHTFSANYPVTPGAFDTGYNGSTDAFVSALNATGTALVYSTYLGGGDRDHSQDIAVDGAGQAYIAGWTQSGDYPATARAFTTGYHGGASDVFVSALNAGGTALVYSTYLGGSEAEFAYGIAVDGAGRAYVTGSTASPTFPVTAGAFAMGLSGSSDVFVTILNAAGSFPVYSTFLGGKHGDIGVGIAARAVGRVYVAGETSSDDFPLTNGAFGTAYSGPSDTFVSVLNIPIAHIEVTQAIQDTANGVPLVAHKPTLARIYYGGVCGEACPARLEITLRAYNEQGELARSPLVQTVKPHKLAFDQARGDLTKTANMTLPPEWLQGAMMLTAQLGGYATVAQSVVFTATATPKIAYLPIRYDGQAPSSRIATAYRFAQRVWPVSHIDYVAWPTWSWEPSPTCRGWGEACLQTDLKRSLNKLLARQGVAPDYLFGWLAESAPIGVLGSSDPTWYTYPDGRAGQGRVAFGVDDPVDGPVILTHELGHNLGRLHTNGYDDPQGRCANPDLWGATPDRDSWHDWPYATAGIQQWGADGASFAWLAGAPYALKDPAAYDDYMSYCWIQSWGGKPAWTSPHTYTRLAEGALKGGSGAQARIVSLPMQSILASGLVFAEGQALLDPLLVMTTTLAVNDPGGDGDYCLEALDGADNVLTGRCFGLSFTDYDTGAYTGIDAFTLAVPYPAGLAKVILRQGAQVLAEQLQSAHAPEIVIVSPQTGDLWDATASQTIAWSGSDDDGDALSYSVFYSVDGQAWLPLASDIDETAIVVAAGELPGGPAAMVRIVATDGLNTVSAESGAFVVRAKAPRVEMLAPSEDIQVGPHSPLLLQGRADDLEDGALPDEALTWSSDLQGALGSGALVLVTLERGAHTIALTATDSDGSSASATARVVVTEDYVLYLPVVRRPAPSGP